MANRTSERERSPAESSGRISIRIKPADEALIVRAAAAQGKKRSEFMIEASRRAAEEAVLDTTLLRVDRETYAQFVELLDKPPQPNEALRNCCSRKPRGRGERPRLSPRWRGWVSPPSATHAAFVTSRNMLDDRVCRRAQASRCRWRNCGLRGAHRSDGGAGHSTRRQPHPDCEGYALCVASPYGIRVG